MHLLRNNVNYKNTINKAWDDESLLYVDKSIMNCAYVSCDYIT